ncbi:hypothetical protein WA026_005940 [Henosepilachna vigintioctopunctata]|uniref:Uncharacterized protein n=1 Tax=Henosepilachna vigintioctopunctata TaxID=420089 RepID=A0AAW1TWM3_9CUCU
MTDASKKLSEKSKGKGGNLKGQQHIVEKPRQLVTPVPESTDPKSIPFPEWTNDDISSAFSSTQISGKSKDKSDKSDKYDKEKTDKQEDVRSFQDPQVLFLPFCLQEAECDWKRAPNIFSEYELVIFTKTNEYPDLLAGSAHLVHSPFIRSFISSVTILEYLANTTHFPTEATTAKFTPNAEGPWKPWHHIYSGGKPTAAHNPQVNNSGKYFVRLFWLGPGEKSLWTITSPWIRQGTYFFPPFRFLPCELRALTPTPR